MTSPTRPKRYQDLVADALTRVLEVQPWDLIERLQSDEPPLLLDVREPDEFAQLRIEGSINVPRGVLEQACEWDYDETVPTLAAREPASIVVICRSGNRSALAADVLLSMGFREVISLRTGVRGWNDYDQPLFDADGKPVDGDEADAMMTARPRPEQRRPK